MMKFVKTLLPHKGALRHHNFCSRLLAICIGGSRTPHTKANSFKSCKAENANSQCNRITHALHTKDRSKLLCSAHTVRKISLVAKIIKHDRYLELPLEWTKSYRNYAHTGAMCWAKWHEWHLAKQIALVCAGFKVGLTWHNCCSHTTRFKSRLIESRAIVYKNRLWDWDMECRHKVSFWFIFS